MKEKKMYCIKIGEFWISRVVIDRDLAFNNFIEGFDVSFYYENCLTYSSANVIALKRHLIELGISEESITIEEYHEEYNTNE